MGKENKKMKKFVEEQIIRSNAKPEPRSLRLNHYDVESLMISYSQEIMKRSCQTPGTRALVISL
jgi:hypothetical protein